MWFLGKKSHLRPLAVLLLVLGGLGWQSACWDGSGGGAAWDEDDIYVAVWAYIDGQQTKYFRAWGWDSQDNYAEAVPSGDQRAFLYLKVPGEIKICARPLYEDVPKQCVTVTAELGVPVPLKFYFSTTQSQEEENYTGGREKTAQR